MGRFYAPLGRLRELRGEVTAQRARQGSQGGNAALSGVSGRFLRFGAMGRFYAPLGRLWGIAWGSPGAACPPGLSGRQCGTSPGFQGGFSPRFGGNWAFLCPSGAFAGLRCVEEDCRVAPAGEFRGCGGGLPGCACGPGGGRGGGAARPGLRRAGVKKAFSETPGRGSPPTARSFAGRAGRPRGPGP